MIRGASDRFWDVLVWVVFGLVGVGALSCAYWVARGAVYLVWG